MNLIFNLVCFAHIMDISLTVEQTLLGFFILIHLISISIFNGQFQKELKKHKLIRTRLRLKILTKEQFENALVKYLQRIRRVKKRAYVSFAAVFLTHASIVLVLSFSWLALLIVHVLFFAVLAVSFWIKGANVVSTIKSTVGFSDYR